MPQRQQMNVGLLVITTLKYKQFFPQLLEGVKKHFLLNHKIKIFLFTDEFISYESNERVSVEQHPIESYRFPEATMLRYFIFNKYRNALSKMDYLYYTDVDMGFVDEIDESIFGRLVGVRHPGFYKGGGSWETRKESATYVEPEFRDKYYAGGFQGGLSDEYLFAIHLMNSMIQEDLINGVVPVWHDESAWNKFLTVCGLFVELTPSYCMVEQKHLQEQWGISHLPPKIVALAKDHKALRE
jgi:hypothetical protein